MARATCETQPVRAQLESVQQDLVALMGELATSLEDLERYLKDGFNRIEPSSTSKIDSWIAELEAQKISFRGWATPGATLHAAALDVARTVCRRAERRVCTLQDRGDMRNPEIIVYLNRLSDWLWLSARAVESAAAK